MADQQQVHVIVGAGLAGAKAAEALRDEGFEGRIVLIGEEPELPYERPPLSKSYLAGESSREEARVHADGFYDDHQIELRTGTRAARLDTDAHQVLLTSGEVVRYDRLLLATGARPRPLPVPGADLVGVHYLRDMADSDAIAARLRDGNRAVVVGAGWIGAEVAAAARAKGVDVALVEQAEVPLEPVLGRQLGEFYAGVHRDHGVELHMGVTVAAFEGDGHVERVRLGDGTRLDCTFVVVGIGAAPRTRLAADVGIAEDNGVLVNASLATSAADVFAAGDIANAYHPFYDRHVRVEHWANALHQPETAARAMLGKPASYDRLPYFFSDQYDVGMEYTGLASGTDQVVIRGDIHAREFIAFWLDGERVAAAMNVNVWDVVPDIETLIRSRQPVDLARLRDPGVALEHVGAGSSAATFPPAA